MIRGVLLCFVGLLLIESRSFAGQTKPRKLNDSDAKVERSDSRPDLAAKFDDVAQLKIASRKSLFHVGEMITIDIALLNTSSQPLFFRKPVEMHINVVTGTGQQMIVQEYVVIDRAIVPASFVRLSPGEIIVHSFQLLAGCDKRAFAQIASTADDDRTVFNRGLFLNWGDACLQSTQPETYTVSGELRNGFILLPRSGKLKTAVGAIKSNSLDMTISN